MKLNEGIIYTLCFLFVFCYFRDFNYFRASNHIFLIVYELVSKYITFHEATRSYKRIITLGRNNRLGGPVIYPTSITISHSPDTSEDRSAEIAESTLTPYCIYITFLSLYLSLSLSLSCFSSRRRTRKSLFAHRLK